MNSTSLKREAPTGDIKWEAGMTCSRVKEGIREILQLQFIVRIHSNTE